MIASEAVPFAKTGGLGDVVGALPAALAGLGHSVTLVIPKYRGVAASGVVVTPAATRIGAARQAVTFHALDLAPRCRVVFVDCPAFFDRAHLYGERGSDYADNALRFDLLTQAALEFALHDPGMPAVDVVHAHDWQAALALVRLRFEARWAPLARAGRMLTIHNLAFQGIGARETVPALGLPWDVFRMDTGEFWGQFNTLKAGISAADVVTTVSPTYARETLTPAMGAGLDGVLATLGERYVGILNGIDTTAWNPATDPHLPARYSAADLSGKAACKRALLEAFGLPRGDDALRRPLVGMVARLTDQKGLDLVDAARASLVAMDAAWVFLGTGDPRHERMLTSLAASHPARVGAHIGFSEPLAHLIEAGSDIFLMPSAFEPCGLNQMYSLRYGTVPVVRAVGGLDDTIQPYTARAKKANGFKFAEGTPDALARTVHRAIRLYHNPPAWRRLMLNGMAADHSWRGPAREYGKVYRQARLLGALRPVR